LFCTLVVPLSGFGQVVEHPLFDLLEAVAATAIADEFAVAFLVERAQARDMSDAAAEVDWGFQNQAVANDAFHSLIYLSKNGTVGTVKNT
jgi:hypothetical protein